MNAAPPAYIVDAARKVMSGIELDPASSEQANEIVKAKRFFTEENDGLGQEWDAETLWLNPPYSRGDIDAFVDKLAAEVNRGVIGEAIVITHNATETRWCRTLLDLSSMFCLLGHRVDFQTDAGQGGGNSGTLRGQIVFYIGEEQGQDRFGLIFKEYGHICVPWGGNDDI